MPSHNLSQDSTRIAPFLTHEVTFHGQTTLIPPDSSGRLRREKQRPQPNQHESSRTRQYSTTTSSQRGQSLDRTMFRPSSIAQRFSACIPDYPPPAYETDCSPESLVPQPSSSNRSPTGASDVAPYSCPSCSCSIRHPAASIAPTSSPTSEFSSASDTSDTGSEASVQMININDTDSQLSPTTSVGNDLPPRSPTLTERFRDGLTRQRTALDLLASPVSTMASSSRSKLGVGGTAASTSMINLNLGQTDSENDPSARPKSLVIVSREESADYDPSQASLQGTCSHQSHQRSASHPFSLIKSGSASSTSLISRPPAFLRSTHSLLPNSSRHKSSPLSASVRTKSSPPSTRIGSSSQSIHSVSTVGSKDGLFHRKSLFTSIRARSDKSRQVEYDPSNETIDDWEVLQRDDTLPSRDDDHPVLHIKETTLNRDEGSIAPSDSVSLAERPPSPPPASESAATPAPTTEALPAASTSTCHPLSMRDRKVAPPPPPSRKTRRPPPPPPLRIPPMPGSPPLVTVRLRKASMAPPRPSRPKRAAESSKPHISEVNESEEQDTLDTAQSELADTSTDTTNTHDIALTIPLPSTPTPSQLFTLPAPVDVPPPSQVEPPAYEPAPAITMPGRPDISETQDAKPRLNYASQSRAVAISQQSSVSSSVIDSPTSALSRHHYQGRPLPTPPQESANSAYSILFPHSPRPQPIAKVLPPPASLSGNTMQRQMSSPIPFTPRSPVWSNASNWRRDETPRTSLATIRPPSMQTPTQYRPIGSFIPEGTLIDFRDSVIVENDLPFSPAQLELPCSPTPSDLSRDDLLLSWETEAEDTQARRLASPRAGDSQSQLASMIPLAPSPPPPLVSPPVTQIGSPSLSELTDLDLLVSQITDQSATAGSDYDTLLMVSEFIGPASPTRMQPARQTDRQPRSPPSVQTTFSTSTTISTSGTFTSNLTSSKLQLHPIQVQRRRITKDGRVKLKLVLLGVGVDKCGICFTQFKDGDMAALGSSGCQHAFHGKCLNSWYTRSRTCPLCRQDAS